jgi:hypothetical protein
MRNYFNKLFEAFEEGYREEHHQNDKLEDILMKLSELLEVNQSVVGKLNKVEAEVVAAVSVLQARIDDLVAGLADVELTAEQAQSVADLQAAAQRLDDLNADPVE